MQDISIEKKTIGVNFLEDGTASVMVWAPMAKKVEIVIESSIALEKKEHGYWEAITDKISEGTRYKISIDDNDLIPDPASLSQPDGVHGTSEAMDLNAIEKSDSNWNNIPLEEYIIYELHTGTFTDNGTFAG